MDTLVKEFVEYLQYIVRIILLTHAYVYIYREYLIKTQLHHLLLFITTKLISYKPTTTIYHHHHLVVKAQKTSCIKC